jgi:predicted transcriptional regulator
VVVNTVTENRANALADAIKAAIKAKRQGARTAAIQMLLGSAS